jgi:hypothetical protein
MPDWLAPVLSAAIAATAVLITTWLNSRSNERQRTADRDERETDRQHENAKWLVQARADKAQWLLDRRAEAYTAFWEWVHLPADSTASMKAKDTIEVKVVAFGSSRVVEAYNAWLAGDGTTWEDPRWQELARRMREDLGSDTAP